jgi:hypothetical protein
MSSETTPQESGDQQALETQAPKKKDSVERTVLRPYPKVVYFYMTWIVALVAGIVVAMYEVTITAENVASDAVAHMHSVQEFWTYLFLVVFTFNLMVVAFQFGRMISVSIVFVSLALLFLGLWLGFLGNVFSFLKNIHPSADSKFFFFVFTLFTVIYVLVFIQTRFNYWVVRRNELLHKHGFLGDVKRYHAQNVKIHKEIPDIFEFILLRSGTIIVHPEGEDRAVVLENIVGINRKESEVKEILESYAVRIDHS